MPAIDSLLRVMTLRDADAMTVAAGQVPSLRRGGNPEPLALPPMTAAMVDGFVGEIANDGVRAELATRNAVEVMYRAADGASYGVLIETVGGGFRLMIRKAPPGAPASLPQPPAVAPLAAVAPIAPTPAPIPPAAPRVPAAPPRVAPTPVVSAVRIDDGSAVRVPARLVAAITHAAERHASDVLASEGQPLRLRVDGEIASAAAGGDDDPIAADDILSLLSDGQRAALDATGSVDLATTLAGARVRINVFRHHGGLGAALRLIRAQPPTVRELGLPDDITSATAYRSGLVLVAGQAGSGKSTTVVALVDHINRTRAAHVITLEDPIEYEHAPRRSLVHQREIGTHAASFADGLRAALRESPDVIVVGELRDQETIAIALTAAETGHLVLGTLHAANGAGAVDRILDVFPEHGRRQARAQVAASLRVVITQHLLPRGAGGRAVAIERVVVTPAIATLIRKNELQMFSAHIQSGRDAGMIPLEKSLAQLARSGAIDIATARGLAQDLELFEQTLRAR
jgi:twitching motility protein PilT